MMPMLLSATTTLIVLAVVFLSIILMGLLITVVKCYRKVEPGTGLIRRGYGGAKVSFNGMMVFPILHRADVMDVSVRRIEIYRHGSEGLICKDNVRADIKVAFFVRVNNAERDLLQVADSIGVRRASDHEQLVELFDSKFSEALKTVGKKFDFTELYTERDRFKDEIVSHIGTDLNGYVLDDAAIDYLEQTSVEKLDPNNILDAEGIKKISDLTAKEAVRANEINREKEKVIKKQDVEARETILELERQQADAEAKQKREIETIQAREQAEADKVRQEERLKAQTARIRTDEELGVAEQNQERQILVARRSKERTDGVELQRVERDSQLEATERERVVELARIEKEKALEVERKKIQDVIRERVMVERAVVEEQQRIRDTEEIMTAERAKTVQVTAATAVAEEDKVKEVKKAEAVKEAAKFRADEVLIAAEANRQAAEKQAQGKMKLAEATRAEAAAEGLAEAEVLDARAVAERNYGMAQTEVIAAKGEAEAKAMREKYTAEADGVAAKAEAMKLLDGVGREHEEFKLRLSKDREVDIAAINVHRDVAAEQARILAEALRNSKIDIVGGDGEFFDRIVNSITSGKQVDRMMSNSRNLELVRDTFFDGTGDFGRRLRQFMDQFGMSTEDVRNLSISALLTRMISQTEDGPILSQLRKMAGYAESSGLATQPVAGVAEVVTPKESGKPGRKSS